MIVGLLLVLIVVGLGMMIARAIGQRNRGGDSAGPGEVAGLRRFFQYLLLFGLTMVVGAGLSGLLGRLLAGGPELARAGDAALARSLTFTVVGFPVLWAVGSWSRRRLAADPGEARSLGWAFFVTATPLVALIVAMVALHWLVRWTMGVDRYDGVELAQLLVWGTVWAGTWVIGRRVPSVDDGRLHRLAGSALGLVVAAGGLGWLLATGLDAVYVAVGGTRRLAGDAPLGEAGAVLIVGAVVWIWYWLRHAIDERRTPLWHGFVLLLGVAGGLTTAVVAGSTVVYDLAVWVFGDAGTTSAGRHFEGVPTALAATGVGALTWWYHRTVLRAAEVGPRGELDRLYEYLVAGVGLVAAAGGMSTVLVALGEVAAGEAVVETGRGPINTLLAALTLLAVGGPVWWWFWQRIGRAMAADPVEESQSTVRRTYLFALFGVVGVVAVISLLVAVFVVFEDLIAGQLDSETLRAARVPLGLLVTTGLVAGYHWTVYRSDRDLAPQPTPRTGRSLVVLVGIPDREVAGAVARASGCPVWQWRRRPADGLVPWSTDAILAALESVDTPEVMLVATTSGLDVVGIDRS